MAADPNLLFERGQQLLANQRFGTPEFTQGFQCLQAAAQSGLPDAQVALGHVYAQVHLLPDAPGQAVRWYRKAAEMGHPAAQDRLADLYMLGWGMAKDDAQALAWYTRTADQYYAMAQCNLAYLYSEGIGTEPDQNRATTLYLQAAAQGEPRAYFNLGLRYASGSGATRNLTHACAWLQSAARLGYPTSDAELEYFEQQLETSEQQAAREIAAAIADNFEALQYRLGRTAGAMESVEVYRRTVEENFAALAMPAFSLDESARLAGAGKTGAEQGPHRATAPRLHSEQPRIFTIDEFVSRGECAHLIQLASMNMLSAQTNTTDTLSQEQVAFTGHAAVFTATACDAVVRNIERRIASAFALPVSHVEPLSVLRYQANDSYAAHVDYFDAARLQENRQKGDVSGQRTASFLVYLRAPELGGETHYLKIDRKIAGQPRMALCHYNMDETGAGNPLTLHTGAPVVQGEKWLARTTLREHPLF